MSTQETNRFLAAGWSEMAPGIELQEQHDPSTDGVRVTLRNAGELSGTVGSALVLPAETDEVLKSSGDPGLEHACLARDLEVTPEGAAALGYALARRARIYDRTNLLLADPSEALCSLVQAQPISANLAVQRVDLCAHYTAGRLSAESTPVSSGLRGAEIRESAERWLAGGKQWGFFRAVHEESLTRAQYVYALSNIYQFVRHTTRLVARAIAHSPTTEMRSHWISHLNGEINHELMIERDLEHLEEDVAFVRDYMAPNGPTQEFMAVQESLIGYHQDPIVLMASPVAAEGVTGHLDEPFIEALRRCVAGFGVAKPAKACRFLTSHMHTDGGDDGHWEMTVRYAGRTLVDEGRHLFFMRSMRNAMRGTERLYESFVQEVPGWGGGLSRGAQASTGSTTVHA